jgi:hypothetical protein
MPDYWRQHRLQQHRLQQMNGFHFQIIYLTICPKCCVLDVPDVAFVPRIEDVENKRKEFIILQTRTLVFHFQGLKDFARTVLSHIKHKFSDSAAKRSQGFPIGLLEHNEKKSQEMIQICKFLHSRHVLCVDGKPVIRVQFGRDQMTTERIRSSILTLSDSSIYEKKVSGLLPHAEDFHCHMNFVHLIYSIFYSDNSFREAGTLRQLKGLLDKRNVAEAANYRGVCSTYAFLEDALDGYIIVSAIQHFHMKKYI